MKISTDTKKIEIQGEKATVNVRRVCNSAQVASRVFLFSNAVATPRTRREQAAAVLKTYGVTGVTLKWSKIAGCSCGCSPGVIVRGEALRTESNYKNDLVDLYVEL